MPPDSSHALGPTPGPAATPGPAGERLPCSARGCRLTAVWALRWNNPRLHTPERRKTWLACADHLQHLSGFLGSRGFLKEQLPVADLPAAPPAGSPDAEPERQRRATDPA